MIANHQLPIKILIEGYVGVNVWYMMWLPINIYLNAD